MSVSMYLSVYLCMCVTVSLCVCASVCIYVCICVCLFVSVCIMCVHLCVCVYVCICIYMYLCVCVCICVYLCVCVSLCLCMSVCVYLCVCVSVYMSLCQGVVPGKGCSVSQPDSFSGPLLLGWRWAGGCWWPGGDLLPEPAFAAHRQVLPGGSPCAVHRAHLRSRGGGRGCRRESGGLRSLSHSAPHRLPRITGWQVRMSRDPGTAYAARRMAAGSPSRSLGH